MYCTISDIVADITEKTLISLSNDNNNPTSIDSTLVNQRISDFSSIIDTYIQGRYTLPLTESNPLLKEICLALTIADLFERRVKEYDTLRQERAWQQLKDIRDGKLQLIAGKTESKTVILCTDKHSVYKFHHKKFLPL